MNEKERLVELLQEINGNWRSFDDWAEKILEAGFHHESIFQKSISELKKFSDDSMNEAISTFIDQRAEIGKLRDALRFISEHGGSVMETEMGDIRCDGDWAKEQAYWAIN